jgi:hypothetical protein
MPVQSAGFHENKTPENNSNILFLKKGVTQLRVLPAYSETGQWFREVREVPLFLEGKFRPQVSPSTIGKPCPFTQEGQKLYNLGGEENVEKAKKFRPRAGYIFNVLVHSTPDGVVDVNECVKVLKCGVKVYRQILDFDQDIAGGWGDITNLENGFDLRITRTGTGRNDTEYVVKGIPGRTNALEYLETKGFAQELHPYNLDEMFAPKSYEELNEMLVDFKATLEPDEDPDPLPETTTPLQMPEAPVMGEALSAPSLEE